MGLGACYPPCRPPDPKNEEGVGVLLVADQLIEGGFDGLAGLTPSIYIFIWLAARWNRLV